MSAANRVIKNTGILYARMAVTMFISLYSTRLILKALGVADFGIFNVVAGAIAMLTFLNSAMAAATQRFMSFAEGAGDKHESIRIYNVSVVLHTLIALFVFILLEIIGYFLFHGILNITAERIGAAQWVYQCMIVSTVFTIISVPDDAVLNAHENMLTFAVISTIESIFKLGTAIFITYTATFDKLMAYGLFTALSAILLLLIRRLYCSKKYAETKIDISKHFDNRLFKDMANFGGWSFIGASSSMLSGYGQVILLNSFFGTTVNTAQGIEVQLKGQLSALANTLLRALNPLIAKSEGAGERLMMLKVSLAGSKYSFLLLSLLYVPVLVDAPYVFKLWLTNVPPFLVIFCRLSLVMSLIQQLFLPIVSAVSAVGDIKKFQVIRSVLNVFPMVLAYTLFAFEYPPYWIYISFIIYSAIDALVILSYAESKCNLQISVFTKDVLIPCLMVFFISLILSTAVSMVLENTFERLVLIVAVAVTSTLFGTWIVVLRQNEKQLFKNLYAKRTI